MTPNDFPYDKIIHIGNGDLSITKSSSWHCIDSKDRWIVGFHYLHRDHVRIFNYDEIRAWVEEINQSNNEFTRLQWDLGYPSIIVDHYDTVIETVLRWS